jgi:hypothetical protein
MRILIQDPGTKYYLDAENHWTSNVNNGREYLSPGEALVACAQYDLTEFLLVVKFKNPDFEIILTRTQAIKLSGQLEVEDWNQLARQAAQ